MESQNTEIICILDRSGSMQTLREETINGINSFIKEQQDIEGVCKLSLVQFNQELNVSFTRTPIREMNRLELNDYTPFGYTALLDAIGLTLRNSMEALFTLQASDRPDKVVVFIITDGLENASRIYSRIKVKEMIERLEANNGWEFNFFGANINSFAEGTSIGIKKDNIENWNFNRTGVNEMADKMSKKAEMLRTKRL